MSTRRPTTVARRGFLQTAALAVAGPVPYIWTGRRAQARSAGDTLGLGFIGVGGHGRRIASNAARHGRRVACADVDLNHARRFAGDASDVHVYQDYRRLLDRKDIDAVTVGTPDHWHVKIAVDALRAGKHVYCEKPLTLTIDEGKILCKVVRSAGKVLQVGTQQRSDRARFLSAVAIARSGRLGSPLVATCGIDGGPAGGPFPTGDPPAHLDWDFWLGQCPAVPYTRQRCHGSFRHWLEYSGGTVTDWGAHHVDIAQWGLGHELSGPVEIEGEGRFPGLPDDFDPVAFFAGRQTIPNGYNAATTFRATLTFADGSQIVLVNRHDHGVDQGIMFEGERGRIFVNRARLVGRPIEELTAADHDWLAEETARLYKGMPFSVDQARADGPDERRPTPYRYVDRSVIDGSHMANFFDAIHQNGEPVNDAFTGHRSASSCHLANIAMLLRRKLRWDPVNEVFLGDDVANALRSRPQRAAYAIQ